MTYTLPKGYLSVSQVEMYLTCPKRYEWIYILGNEDPYSKHMMEGLVMMEVVEASCRRWSKSGAHFMFDQAKVHWSKVFNREAKRVTAWHGESKERVEARGKQLLRVLFRAGGPDYQPCMMPDKKLGVEWEFSVPLGGVPFVGFVDVVEDEGVIDLKVARNGDHYDPARSFQSLAYRVVAQKPRFQFDVLHKEGLFLEPKAHRLKSLDTAREWVEETVDAVARGISSGSFPPCLPAKNSLCAKKWCSRWEHCFGKVI